ncbi:hypothetical protein AAG570_004536 [Ranatra chinensis]|uniref:CHK kinase-like domain-containing protein n=1 Tax=Ranatra chinensis TaxID=642074 RepID=A0ABD0YMZ0_9HEMI
MLSASECDTIVRQVIDGDYKILDHEFTKACGGSGFLGDPSFLTIRYKKKHTLEKDQELCRDGDMSEKLELSFFAKQMPKGNIQKEALVRRIGVFTKEAQLYKNVLQPMEKYIEPKIYPRYYYSRDDDMLVLENLAPFGFRTKEPAEPYELDHCRAVVEAVARFQAASVFFESKVSTCFDKYVPQLMVETLFTNKKDHPSYKHIEVSIDAIKGIILEHFPQLSDTVRDGVMEILRSTRRICRPSRKFRNILTHGDLWSNNILFSYDTSGKVKDVRLVDFQLVRYAPPAIDILLFMHLTTTRQFRLDHESELLDHYYETFKRSLHSYGISVDDVIPCLQFVSTVKSYRPTVLGIAALYLHYILLPAEKIKHFMDDPEMYDRIVANNRRDLVSECLRDYEYYRNRVLDSVLEIIESVN